MTNLKNKYDWNNPKELNNERLYKEFKASSERDKAVILNFLNEDRRKMLHIKSVKEHKEEQIKSFLKDVNFILSPLKGFIELGNTIKGSEIKNGYELMLIYQMMYMIRINFLSTVKKRAIPAEQISFNKAREKMIDFINIMNERKNGILAPIKENDLIKQLEAFEYAPPTLEENAKAATKTIYLKMMDTAGIGKERALKLYGGLVKYNKSLNKLNKKDKQLHREALISFDSQIPNEFKADAQSYFYHIFNHSKQ